MGPSKPAKKKKAGGVKVSSQTPVFGSIEDGDKDEFDECLSQTPDCIHETNKNGWTPLHQAAFSGELEMLSALLAAGAKINETDHDAFTVGVKDRHATSSHLYSDWNRDNTWSIARNNCEPNMISSCS